MSVLATMNSTPSRPPLDHRVDGVAAAAADADDLDLRVIDVVEFDECHGFDCPLVSPYESGAIHRGQLFDRPWSIVMSDRMRGCACLSRSSGCGGNGGGDDGGSVDAYDFMDAPAPGDSPIIGGCPVFPANSIFNTPIGALPVDPQLGRVHHDDRLHEEAPPRSRTRRRPDSDTSTASRTTSCTAHRSRGRPRVLRGRHRRLQLEPRRRERLRRRGARASSRRADRRADPADPGEPDRRGRHQHHRQPDARRRSPHADRRRRRVPAVGDCITRTRPSSGRGTSSARRRGTCTRTRCAPADWSSADAAGLPILPLLLKADEASVGHDQARAALHDRLVRRSA